MFVILAPLLGIVSWALTHIPSQGQPDFQEKKIKSVSEYDAWMKDVSRQCLLAP